jgi:hypothetical protein
MSSPNENRATVEAAATRLDPESIAGQTSAGVRRMIGEFEIIELLGEGAMAHVYLARQTSLGRLVALKINKRTGGELPEGPLLAGLEHDHIVKVFSTVLDAETGARGLCLQYIAGADLGTVIHAIHDGKYPPASGRAVLEALDANARGEAGFDPASLRDREALAGDDFAQADWEHAWPRRLPLPMPAACSTATSNPPTSSSRATAGRCWPTSTSPSIAHACPRRWAEHCRT